GYSWDEAIGKNPRILKSGKMPNNVYEKMWKKISSGKVWSGELLNKKKDGTLYWENVTISPITNSEGEIINLLGVKEDITEAKKNKLILTEAKEKAEQSDKLKSEFLAQMSHEIRTPVNSILSFSNLLKQDFFNEDNEELSLIFNSIDSASKRIIRTIEMIINMAEIQSGSYDVCFKEINFVEKILDPLIEEYKMIAELRGLKLIFESDANSKKNIVLDEYSATQIFTNLLDNAIKYTVKGFIKVAAKWDSDSRLNVEVSDSGIGIPTDEINKIFHQFYRATNIPSKYIEGSGLGLSLVKEIVERLNGTVEITSPSKIGNKKFPGTTVTIQFPKNQLS
ncbi:MAG: PAS domain S-box protein, partial [Ignavibacteriae bacterium]|nr:PAS domain S-box protein [Ignavibacteriota bacterium]